MTAKDERGEWGGTEPDQLALRVGQDHRTLRLQLDERCRRLKQRIEAEREIGEIAEPIRREVWRWLEKPRRRDHDESCMICDVCYTDEGGYGQSPGCPERQEATARSQCPN